MAGADGFMNGVSSLRSWLIFGNHFIRTAIVLNSSCALTHFELHGKQGVSMGLIWVFNPIN
jgi:hypothetical protein